MCLIMRSRFSINESVNSAPFLMSAVLNFSKVFFFFARLIINSAENYIERL